MTDGFIRTAGPELAESGFLVCPIAPGEKRPLGKDWGNRPLSAAACRAFSPEAAGAGIICGKGETPVYGLDFDIEGDADFAEEMRSEAAGILGIAEESLWWRVGLPPKFLIPVRGEAGLRKQATSFWVKQGAKARLEILGEGQQFVAAAIHPSTGQPYAWHGDMLLSEYPMTKELPVVTREKIAALMAAFERLAPDHGFAEEASVGRAPQDPFADDDDDLDRALTPQNPVGMSIADAEKYIADLNAEDYETWIAVGMSLHHEFGGTEHEADAMALWERWSEKAPNFRGHSDIAYRWGGFGNTSAGHARTMRWIVREWKKSHFDWARDLSDKGLAARMLEHFNEKNESGVGALVYCDERASWYRFDGIHWRYQPPGEMKCLGCYGRSELLRADIDQIKDPELMAKAMRFWKAGLTGRKYLDLVSAMEAEPGFYKREKDFDEDSHIFGVANGDIDLRTCTFLPPSKDRLTTLASDVAYDPDAKCPLWEQTLLEAMCGDREMAAFLQLIFGYALVGKPTEEMAFFFFGNGANGKSTVINTVRGVFGQYAVAVPVDTLTTVGRRNSAQAGGARSDLMQLERKRIAFTTETEEVARLNEGTLKALASTDKITARGLYEKAPREFDPTFVLFIVTNHMPSIYGVTEGIWRRVVPIRWGADFTKSMDTARAEKLKAEYPGILNWLLDGVRRYGALKKAGKKLRDVIPASVDEEANQVRDENDVLADWLAERCELAPEAVVPVAQAWASWEQYANANGQAGLVPNKKALTQRLKGKGVKACRMTYQGKQMRVYQGLRLVDALEGIQ